MPNRITAFFLPTIGVQLTIFLMIILVCRDEKSSVKKLGFRNFNFLSILYAIIFLFASSIILKALSELLVDVEFLQFKNTAQLLPHTIFEKIVWVLLSAIVAFNEESAYRGYLITRLTKITRSPAIAVLIACMAFGAGHFYQGTGRMILIFIYGLMFAGLYLSTRSLWPGVIAHFINDAIMIFSGSLFMIPPF